VTTLASLTITDLFTPAPSGVGGSPSLPPVSGSWLATLLSIATMVQLPTTSWQAGEPERTILALDAVSLAQVDANVSVIAQGGFLDFAASGTVTYVNVDGVGVVQAVTPDPSDPAENPTGAPGWLDLLGQSVYNATRLSATYATVSVALVNTSNSAAGPYVSGTYHLANTRTKATYSNVGSLTIPSSIIAGTGGVVVGVTIGASQTTIQTQTAHGLSAGATVYLNGIQGVSGLNGNFALLTSVTATTLTVPLGSSGAWTSAGTVYACTVAPMIADVIGTFANAAPGDITTTVTQANGVGCFNLLAGSAANWESNVNYAARCRLKLATISPNGPSDAYVYFALSAQALLAAETPSIALTNGPVIAAIAYSNPQTGVVNTVVASSTPASNILGQPVTPGCVQLPVTGATNTSPIRITTAAPHGLLTGNAVTIQGVIGNTNANTTALITVLSINSFSLNGVNGNGAYASGGVVDGGDLGQIDNLLQLKCVPDNTTEIALSALAFPVAISATVVVPQVFAAAYRLQVNAALQAYLASLPIGGAIVNSVGIVSFAEVDAALSAIGITVLGGTSYVRTITGLTLNGLTTDLPTPTPQSQCLLGTVSVTVVGV
jgi:hypothetical protein